MLFNSIQFNSKDKKEEKEKKCIPLETLRSTKGGGGQWCWWRWGDRSLRHTDDARWCREEEEGDDWWPWQGDQECRSRLGNSDTDLAKMTKPTYPAARRLALPISNKTIYAISITAITNSFNWIGQSSTCHRISTPSLGWVSHATPQNPSIDAYICNRK